GDDQTDARVVRECQGRVVEGGAGAGVPAERGEHAGLAQGGPRLTRIERGGIAIDRERLGVPSRGYVDGSETLEWLLLERIAAEFGRNSEGLVASSRRPGVGHSQSGADAAIDRVAPLQLFQVDTGFVRSAGGDQ